jgi:hypothetical protein
LISAAADLPSHRSPQQKRQKQPRQEGGKNRKFSPKLFLHFPQILLKRVLSIAEIGKRNLFFDSPPGRFGSSRPRLRSKLVSE